MRSRSRPAARHSSVRHPRIWTGMGNVSRFHAISRVSTTDIARLLVGMRDRDGNAGILGGGARTVGRSIIGSSGEGEGVAHTSGSHSRHHSIRVADVDLSDRHIAGQELGQRLHAKAGSTIERIAHGSRVRILAVSQAAEARRVLAPGRFLLLHLYTWPRDGKAIPLACCSLFLPLFFFFPPLFAFLPGSGVTRMPSRVPERRR